MGRGPRDRRRRAGPGGPGPADGAAAPRRASAGAALRGDGETESDAARRLALTCSTDRAADPGPAGVGQDLQRRTDDRDAAGGGQAGRHHGDQPQGHRQPHQGGPRGRRGGRRRTSGRSSTASPTRSTDDRVVRAKDAAATSPTQLADGRANLVGGHDLALGVAEDGRRGRRAVRRRGGPDLARQRGRRLARRRRLVLLGDPQQLDQPIQGTPSARRRRAPRSPTCSATTRRSRRIAACSSTTTWRLHPDLCRLHVGGRSTRAGSSPSRHLARQAPRGRRPGPRRRRACARRGRARRATDNESPDEAERRRDDGARELVEGGATWIDRTGRSSAPLTLGRRPDRRALQRPGRARSSACCRRRARVGTVDKFQGQEAPVSIYSLTTLEARGRAARDGLPVQRPPPQRRDVAGPLRRGRRRRRRTCWRVRARTPDQMRLANAFCRFVEMAEAPLRRSRGRRPGSRRPLEVLTLGLD